jgi:hypothetical protein
MIEFKVSRNGDKESYDGRPAVPLVIMIRVAPNVLSAADVGRMEVCVWRANGISKLEDWVKQVWQAKNDPGKSAEPTPEFVAAITQVGRHLYAQYRLVTIVVDTANATKGDEAAKVAATTQAVLDSEVGKEWKVNADWATKFVPAAVSAFKTRAAQSTPVPTRRPTPEPSAQAAGPSFDDFGTPPAEVPQPARLQTGAPTPTPKKEDAFPRTQGEIRFGDPWWMRAAIGLGGLLLGVALGFSVWGLG